MFSIPRPVHIKPINQTTIQANPYKIRDNQSSVRNNSYYGDMLRKNSKGLDNLAPNQQVSTTDALLQEIRDMMSMMKQIMGQKAAMTNLLLI